MPKQSQYGIQDECCISWHDLINVHVPDSCQSKRQLDSSSMVKHSRCTLKKAQKLAAVYVEVHLCPCE